MNNVIDPTEQIPETKTKSLRDKAWNSRAGRIVLAGLGITIAAGGAAGGTLYAISPGSQRTKQEQVVNAGPTGDIQTKEALAVASDPILSNLDRINVDGGKFFVGLGQSKEDPKRIKPAIYERSLTPNNQEGFKAGNKALQGLAKEVGGDLSQEEIVPVQFNQ